MSFVRSRAGSLVACLALLAVGCTRQVCPPTTAGNGARAVPAAANGADAPTPPIKIVRVTLSPPEAVVTIKGERIDHPSGFVDLPGPVGYVFDLQIAANGSRVAKRVEVTESGAEPAAIAIAGPTDAKAPPEADPVAADLLRAAAERRAHAVEGATEPPSIQAQIGRSKTGAITITSYPWAKVSEGSREICTTPCTNLLLPAGVHTLVLTNRDVGITKKIVITVRPGETTAVKTALIPPTRD